METHEILKEQIFEIIKSQIKDHDPPETKQTLERLKSLGYSDLDAKKLIGQCVVVEIFNVIKHEKTFDELRYIKNLKNLPKEPVE